ncbi:hypothetical protein Back11_27260 [Paenibacillus baekrokdamisoli]|uniref:Uncharacterized protein n=1 Tax=Paenibacillus baekrokdamisoli TaxID=1712516 RepID=A0A3G9J6I8_9BACL|nr:hypothetical protein Back11_27260 [Paenibacillus baekrokdamisoli]
MLFTLILLVGCQDKSTLSDQIIKEIDSKCMMNDYCNISLQEITTFKWDKMAIFQVGSSNSQISKALGVEYKGPTDLMTGMIFVLNNQIVYEEKIPYDPEHPSKLQILIERKPNEPSCVSFTLKNAVVQGEKEKIDGVTYYSINTKIE